MLGPGVWNHSLYPPTHRPKDEARPEGRLELLLLRGGHRRAPPMVRLVFCLASPPATSSRLVEHAKLTQRVEAGVAATKARGWLGRKGGWHWPGAYVSTDGPASVSGPWRGQGSPGKRWAAAPREGFHRLEESPGLWGRRSLASGEPSSPAQPESPSPTLCLGLEGLGTRRTQKALTRGAEAGRLKQRLGSWGGGSLGWCVLQSTAPMAAAGARRGRLGPGPGLIFPWGRGFSGQAGRDVRPGTFPLPAGPTE